MGPRRVLVIEDDDAVRLALEVFLSAEDSVGQVVTAADGNEGIGAARSVHPDVIVTDCNMPGLAGEELGQALRSSCPDAAIISFSGLLQDAPWADRRIQKGGPDTFDDLARAVGGAEVKRPSPPSAVSSGVDRDTVHELRNLLTPISGYAGLLAAEGEHMQSRQVKEIAQRIVDAVERLNQRFRTL